MIQVNDWFFFVLDLRNERNGGKLPIHLRLGTTDNFDTDLAIAKKSKQLSEYDGRKKRIGLQVEYRIVFSQIFDICFI